MPRFTLGMLLGLLVGASLALAGQAWLQNVRTHEALDAAKTQDRLKLEQLTATWAKEAESQAAEVKRLTGLNDQLAQEVASLKKPLPAASPSPSPATTAAAKPPAAFMKAGMEMYRKQKLTALKSRLNLTPYQEQQLSDALDEQMKGVGNVFEGKSSSAPKGASLDKVADSVLTPEQKATYEQMKADERKGQIEMMTTQELNQLGSSIHLTEQQKDDAYRALYTLQEQQFNPQKTQPGQPKVDMNGFLDRQSAAKAEAMASILTPDQLATYRKNLKMQTEMQKAMLEKMLPQKPQ